MIGREFSEVGSGLVPPTAETRAAFDEAMDALKAQAEPGNVNTLEVREEFDDSERSGDFVARLWSLQSNGMLPFYAVDVEVLPISGFPEGQEHEPAVAAQLVDGLVSQYQHKENRYTESMVRGLYQAAVDGEITGDSYRALLETMPRIAHYSPRDPAQQRTTSMMRPDTRDVTGLNKQFADGSRVAAWFLPKSWLLAFGEYLVGRVEVLTGPDETGLRAYYDYKLVERGADTLKSVNDDSPPPQRKISGQPERIDIPRISVRSSAEPPARFALSEQKLAGLAVALRNALDAGESPGDI